MEVFFSIITICYNSLSGLKKTCDSVICQTEKDYEYIVIDGNSNDGTASFLESCRAEYAKKGNRFVYVSEADDGIYQAMNKGIRCANGLFFIFMNAGDTFQDANTLLEVKKHILPEDELIYGNAKYIRNGYTKECATDSIALLPYRMPFSHQALFVRKDIMQKYMYDERYKICGDREFLTRCHVNHRVFKKIDCGVCVYDFEGISATNMIGTAVETYQIYKNLELPWSMNRMKALLAVVQAYVLTWIRDIMPPRMLEKIRKIRFSHGAWKKESDR